jgi:hypothetical protein
MQPLPSTASQAQRLARVMAALRDIEMMSFRDSAAERIASTALADIAPLAANLGVPVPPKRNEGNPYAYKRPDGTWHWPVTVAPNGHVFVGSSHAVADNDCFMGFYSAEEGLYWYSDDPVEPMCNPPVQVGDIQALQHYVDNSFSGGIPLGQAGQVPVPARWQPWA